MRLWESTSPELAAAAAVDPLVLLPVGSVEQHAAHLPTGTDSLLVQAVADRVEAARPDTVLLAAPVWYGASGHHLAFPGSTSVDGGRLADLLLDVVRSLHRSTGLRRFLVLNGHGGNEAPLRVAMDRLRDDGPPGVRAAAASYWSAMFEAMTAAGRPHPAGMGHACEIETSLMLALHPHLVHPELARPDERVRGRAWLFEAVGFDELTGQGGMGDPTRADAEWGRWMLELAVTQVVALTETLRADPLPA